MITLGFQLTMPNAGSWNGKWTGEGKFYFRSRTILKKDEERIKEMLEGKEYVNFYYRWDDGWGANVRMSIMTSQEARRLNKKSIGFYGYEWMINSIIKYGEITIF